MLPSFHVHRPVELVRTIALSCAILSHSLSTSAATLQIQITPKIFGENLQPASLRYQTSANESFSITRVSYLVSDFALLRNNGSWFKLSNSVAWLDFQQNRDSIRLEPIPAGEFRALRFNVGLDPNMNHADI